MAVASIDELCKGYCEIAGLQAPELEVDEYGVKSFTVSVRATSIVVAQYVNTRPDDVVVLVEIGRPPPAHEARLLILLLELNRDLLAEGAPCFSCKSDGRIFCQRSWNLVEMSPMLLAETLSDLAIAGQRWRESFAALELVEPDTVGEGVFQFAAPQGVTS